MFPLIYKMMLIRRAEIPRARFEPTISVIKIVAVARYKYPVHLI